MDSSQYDKLLNPTYIKLCVIELCLQLGMQTTQTVTSNAALALGATVTVAGILAGLSSAVTLVLRIGCGRIVSRTPLKKVLVASAAILFASSLVFALFGSIEVLGFTRAVYGVGIVVKSVIGVAICVRVVPKESLGQGVAWLGMANILCVAVGPNLAQFIGLNFGYSYTFMFSAIMFALGLLGSITFPSLPLIGPSEESPEKANAHEASPAQNVETPARERKTFAGFLGSFIYFPALPIAVMGLLEGAIFGIVNTLTLTASALRGMPETSVFFVAYVVVSFCMRPVLGKLYDRYGFQKVCPPMCALMALSMLSFAFTDSMLLIIVDGVLFALGQGCLWPCLQAENVRDVPLDKSSLSANTLLLGVDMGIAFGPMIAGAIMDAAGPTVMYLFAAGIGLCLTLWTIPYTRIMRNREQAAKN